MLGHAPHEHDIGHCLKYAEAVDPARDPNGQAFAGMLVNQRHQPELAAIVGLGLNKVVGPDMIAPLWPQPDAGPIIEPEPASWPLFLGYFQPLATPDPLHPIAAHTPPGLVQQRLDPTIAVSAVLRCQRNNSLRQRILISTNYGGVTLRSAGLTDNPAGMTLRETILPPNAINGLPAPFGAYKFPEATSLRTCFSSDRSATRRFRRTFSRSRSFIRLA